jgi:hypothetical protein
MNFGCTTWKFVNKEKKRTQFFAIRTSSNTREEKKLSPAGAGAGIEPKLTRVESGELCCSLSFALWGVSKAHLHVTHLQRVSKCGVGIRGVDNKKHKG